MILLYIAQGIIMVFPIQEFPLYFVQRSETRFTEANSKQKVLVFISFPNYKVSTEGRQKFQWQISTSSRAQLCKSPGEAHRTSLPSCEPRLCPLPQGLDLSLVGALLLETLVQPQGQWLLHIIWYNATTALLLHITSATPIFFWVYILLANPSYSDPVIMNNSLH